MRHRRRTHTAFFCDVPGAQIVRSFLPGNAITFTKRVLEDLNYPANVQYGFDPEHHVFAIKP